MQQTSFKQQAQSCVPYLSHYSCSEGRSPQENAPASWHNDRDQNAWRHSGRSRSFEDEPPHNGMRGPHRGGSDKDRERWDRERGEKEMGTSAPRNSGPRPYLENHRPLNPPGFGGARWGESRPGPGGRFRPDERDRDGYSGPGRELGRLLLSSQ